MSRLPDNVCIVCGKPKDDTFYDKSKYRLICNRECYSKYFDMWKKRDDDMYNDSRRLLQNRRASKKYRKTHRDQWNKYQREYAARRRLQG